MPPAEPPAAPVLLVTADSGLRDELARLVAAVGLAAEVVGDTAAAGPGWLDAGLVLVDAVAAGAGVPVRRPGVVLVQAGAGDERVWRWAVEVGAEAVARLPQDEGWLVDRLALALDGHRAPGAVIGVIGGRGGAGASTLAAALSQAAVREGREVVLVDADPAGGGVDLLLSSRHEPGLRWSDLASVRGAVRGSVLREALPVCAGVRVVTWEREDASPVPVDAMEAVLDAARRCHDLVVVDLSRRVDDAVSAALWRLDVLLLVVPAEARATAAAASVLAGLGRHVRHVRLVVRGPAPTGWSAAAVADGVGLPCAYRWAYEPGLPEAGELARLPRGRRSPTARVVREVLDELAAPQRSAAPAGAAR